MEINAEVTLSFFFRARYSRCFLASISVRGTPHSTQLSFLCFSTPLFQLLSTQPAIELADYFCFGVAKKDQTIRLGLACTY